MYFSPRRPQQLGFWGELVSAAVTIGSKSIDKSIAKKNAAIEQQRIALEEKRQQLELVKLQNQQRIAEMQINREMQEAQMNPIARAGQALSKPVTLPGIGTMPLSYVLIPAVALLAVILMRGRK